MGEADQIMNRPKIKAQVVEAQIKVYGIECLYYMLPLENVLSVMKSGILSHNRAKLLPHRSFADASVQWRRDHLIIPGANKHIHDYVPLYFTTHTPMQYVLTQGANSVIDQEELVFIEVDAVKAFSTPGAVFTDGNVASGETYIHTDLEGLSELDWHVIREVPNCYSREYKRKKAAEVLVPDHVPSDHFLRAVVFNAKVQKRLSRVVRCACEVDLRHYY